MKEKSIVIKIFSLFLTLIFALSNFSCAVNPVTGKQQLMFFSEEGELELGKNYFPSAIWGSEGGGGEYKDEKLRAYLDGIVQKLHKNSHRPHLPCKFYIQNSSIPNAWALPGYVAITRGLLAELDNEAEFAFVMGHEIGHVSARFGYNFLKNHHISLGFQHWKGWNIGSPGARYEPDIDDKKEIERNRIEINYKTENFNANYYFNNDRRENYEGSQTGKWETPGEISITKTKTQGLSILKILPINEHRILIGGQWDRINIKSSRNTGSPYNPNSQYDSYGLFTEGRLSLLEKKLIIHAGLRYDYFENKILSTEGIKNLKPREENLDNFTFRGGLLYKITENLHIKTNAGTAFRVPSPEELASDFISGGKRYFGNSQLKPEKSASYEIGISYTEESLKSEITFFHSKFKNKILRYEDAILNAYTYKNIDGATIQGFESEFSYELSQFLGTKFLLEPFANFTYHTRYLSKDETEISKYGKTLTYIPKWTGAFGVKTGQENWDLRLIGNYMGDEKVIDWSPSGNGKVVTKGDFTVFNLKASYRPIKNLEITASIENLFDRAYEYVQYYPMPRRTFTGSMKWIF